jgi:hypothetical protein
MYARAVLVRRRLSGSARPALQVSLTACAAAPRVTEGEAWSCRLELGWRRLGGALISRWRWIRHPRAAIGDAVAKLGSRFKLWHGVLCAMLLMRMPFRRVEDDEENFSTRFARGTKGMKLY